MSEHTRDRRSETTKAAIMMAAREEFAAKGYQAATIRAIAANAGIDPALVIRYFGNKQDLFAAAAQFDLQLPDLKEVPKRALGAALVEHFFHRWERDETLMPLRACAASS
jgi:AcrR family transcriptional regulator